MPSSLGGLFRFVFRLDMNSSKYLIMRDSLKDFSRKNLKKLHQTTEEVDLIGVPGLPSKHFRSIFVQKVSKDFV